MTAVHLLTGEMESGIGGVGDYTRVLAAALTAGGAIVRTWDVRDPRLRGALPNALRAQPGYVLLQYVPNTLGKRGANVGFCRWLLSLSRSGADIRVMFHEPYFYFSWNPLHAGLAVVQRAMAALLLRASSLNYVSTEQWLRYLSPYAPAEAIFTVLPVPSTLPSSTPDAATASWRERFGGTTQPVIGHFGTYGDHVATDLEPIVTAVLGRGEAVTFACIGRGSTAFVARLHGRHADSQTRVMATGDLSAEDAAAAITACDVLVQPYPDGVTTRRTSVMAPLALGVATVTSRGFLTEPIWTEAAPVALARASDPEAHAAAVVALVHDATARHELASRGRAVYDAQFGIARTVAALLR